MVKKVAVVLGSLIFAMVLYADLGLVFPPNNAYLFDPTPTFIWRQVPDASNYLLELDESEDFSSPLINVWINDTFYTSESPIPESLYYWRVIIETPEVETSDVWQVHIQTKGPELISPPADANLSSKRVTFIWHTLLGAREYNIKVIPEGSVTPVIDLTTSDTIVTPLTYLSAGNYGWYVGATDSFSNQSENSETWFFTIVQTPASWQELDSMPSAPSASKKNVKDGGSLVSVGNILYAFRGNKSNEFYKYDGTWTACEMIGFGPKETRPTQLNQKTVAKGAALCYSPYNNMIYATKGNGTKEFWAYDIAHDTWYFKGFVPIAKGLKGGTALAFYDGRVYILAGAQRADPGTKNFLAYDINTQIWDTLKEAPTYTGKPYKDGSAIVNLGDKIFCLMGGANENYFSVYKIQDDTWERKTNLPLTHPASPRKNNKVKDGAALASDGFLIYAIKGGKVNEFWAYYPESDSWVGLETIPRRQSSDPKYVKQSVPKTGAALACDLLGNVYLLKGNGTNEFWKYTPRVSVLNKTQNFASLNIQNTKTVSTQVKNLQVTIKPQSLVVRFEAQKPEQVSIKLINLLGQVLMKSSFDVLEPGSYEVSLPKTSLASGIYFVQYSAGNNMTTARLIIE
jgi:hypothetical protein